VKEVGQRQQTLEKKLLEELLDCCQGTEAPTTYWHLLMTMDVLRVKINQR
jgi:hypothetical protein